MEVDAAIQHERAVNLISTQVTPESAPKSQGIKWDEANPVASLGQLDLFKASTPLKKTAIAFSLVWLGNLALNACFVPYVDAKFGWGPQQSGPLLVVVGLMLAVVPKLVVPRLGVVGAANFGCLVYALGFICAASAPVWKSTSELDYPS